MLQYFFPYNYRMNIVTSLNVGPVLLKSAQRKHIPEVNCMHNGFAVWDQFCKQFGPSLSCSAWGIWPISDCSCHQQPLRLVWENVLRWAESRPGEGSCLSTDTTVSLERGTSIFTVVWMPKLRLAKARLLSMNVLITQVTTPSSVVWM